VDGAGRVARQDLTGPVGGAGAQAVEGDGYQPGADVALLVWIDWSRGAAAELLDQPGDVHGRGIGSQAAVAVCAGGDFGHAFHALLGDAAHFGGRACP
jgi:hypothetical protein